ncbi:HAD family hydrolase [Streptomyces sp. 900116325]
MDRLGLPDTIEACLFDMDGVITKTASVHAAAWKQAFNEFLHRRDGDDYRQFDEVRDYDTYVDGKPRADGVRSFLASRGITLPEESDAEDPEAATVRTLGDRKNDILTQMIRTRGVEVYETTIEYVRKARQLNLKTAVVSSSTNCREILESAAAECLFDVRIDGVVAAERGLPGKPHPDTFLAAAHDLGSLPSASAVFEDALAGMEAGRSGRFGFVVGVDRAGQADELRAHGADVVVRDLAELE